ncbi:MAG: hypothetical protein IJ723_01920 [Ruminococcus sp.]|nr:hypothetical protein [Ruminococcus sp.]
MREILYRGKRIDSGEWAYGDLLTCDDEMEIYSESHGENGGWVIPETVGEYTGLTDENGVKIFEGDIVYLYGDKGTDTQFINYKALVVFVHGGFCAIDGTLDDYSLVRFDFTSTLNCEIIGNIHDNPELLGGDQNA